ncbi:nitrate regulatory protein [Azospirillum halopraeferens]|uniref:nitrate regulatory protein n=1 Tax=Azospirillum halopraeferens TaxID=34010 RepID=UPI0003F958B6|nr:nitrate regulatory protein [Azospirillum halopraeferens]
MDNPPARPATGEPAAPAARFLRSALLCRIRDLEQLAIVSELVRDAGELIHALQKERGASSIHLGSGGERFADRLARRTAECRALERVVRDRLERVDERLGRMSSGARFYSRVAFALMALDKADGLRARITAGALAPLDAVSAFTDMIGRLMAVIFEAADIAADPAMSRALVALVNAIQGKEYAGQERATAGAGFSRGVFEDADRRRLRDLAAAQNRAFRVFAEFAEPAWVARFHAALAIPASAAVERMRAAALTGDGSAAGISGEEWYEQATLRIDAMKAVEDGLVDELCRLCAVTLTAARRDLERHDAGTGPDGAGEADTATPVAMLVMDADPAARGPEDTPGLYTLDGIRPRLMRSVVDLMHAQSRLLQDVSSQLESARTELHERKQIDRAKGLLMSSRGLSERDAYALMRKTAMNQNKRIVQVAEAIVSMAEILGPPRCG